MTRQGRFEVVDVVVVLGAPPTAAGAPGPRMRRRMAGGVGAFRRSAAQALLVTGGPPGADPTEAALMRDLAIAAGVPRSRIVVEPTAGSTFDNAARSAEIMRARGWSKALVVTDALHLPRALLAFRAEGVRARGRSAGPGPGGAAQRALWREAAYEAAALLCYGAAILLRRRRRGPPTAADPGRSRDSRDGPGRSAHDGRRSRY